MLSYSRLFLASLKTCRVWVIRDKQQPRWLRNGRWLRSKQRSSGANMCPRARDYLVGVGGLNEFLLCIGVFFVDVWVVLPRFLFMFHREQRAERALKGQQEHRDEEKGEEEGTL